MVDNYGIEIAPLDFIIYPVRSGSSVWMRQARVIEIFKGAGRYQPKLRVIGADWQGWGERRKVGAYVTNISNLGNTIVVPSAVLPAEFRAAIGQKMMELDLMEVIRG